MAVVATASQSLLLPCPLLNRLTSLFILVIDIYYGHLSSLPLLQILVAVVFRRQLVEPLNYPVTHSRRPPDEAIFDLMNLEHLSDNLKSVGIWDLVLRSGWIHGPASQARHQGWMSMLRRGMSSSNLKTSFLYAKVDRITLSLSLPRAPCLSHQTARRLSLEPGRTSSRPLG